MTRKLYVMRHAETLFNLQKKIQGWCDSPLTERGIKQAKAAGVLIRERGITFDHAYCSTAERCSDTLEITTAEAFGKPMGYVRCKGLREYGFGQFEGKDECLNPKAPFGTFFKAYGGESDDEVIARIGSTMHEIMGRDGHESVFVVSHAGASVHFYLDCTDHSRTKVDRMCNCMIYEYEYVDHEFIATDFMIPDLEPLEEPGMPPQIRHMPELLQ